MNRRCSLPDPKRKAGRPYKARFCFCGNEAGYAVQILWRTIGRGQRVGVRKIKLGGSVILCERCSRQFDLYARELEKTSVDTATAVRRRRSDPQPELFD